MELIDKYSLVGTDGLFSKRGCAGNCQYCNLWSKEGCRVIIEAPIVDAVEVVHGRWIEGYPIHCSVCGGAAPTDYEDCNRYEAWLTPYCPNCGARMDGGN